MASASHLRVQHVGEFHYLMDGAEFVCELPDWVDHTARIKVIPEPSDRTVKIIVAQPNHAPAIYDAENKKWRPL